MLTKVILDGPMGKAFGKNWNLQVNSPNEALRLIDANKPGVFRWIKTNLAKYSRYKVVCEYEDGSKESLDSDSYVFERKAKSIRFVPIIEGAGGGVGTTILGAVLVIVGAVLIYASGGTGSPLGTKLIVMGAMMMLGGVIQMLSPKPNMNQQQQDGSGTSKSSYYFDGPANTSTQGVPVQLVYGRCLVGSHTISAVATVDQLI